MNKQPNLTCTICGEKDFHLKEGFYYCNECGTKSEQVRDIEVERAEDFDGPVKHKHQIKIKEKGTDKPELTSWECYNYILRGMVEELIELGAKDELKPMVFQIWAAFLRNREVAFFSRRHPELPKLGIRYEKRDAAILYNHAMNRQKAKRERKENGSNASGSKREWKRRLKKLDRSQYEVSMSQSMCSQSLMSQTSYTDTSFNSSGSAPSNRAIQLKFSSTARKQLKKKIPQAHLKKHETDFNKSLECHNMSLKFKELKFRDRTKELSLKLVYAILAVALNLIEDDIQLTDLLRFVSEGHTSTSNLQRFFPSDTSESCKEALSIYRLYSKSTEFAAAQLRAQCAQVGKAINLNYFKTPDIFKIVQRYTTELCLPEEINNFIERLINLHPPKMDWVGRGTSPPYESRAMAYIIFTLKLLFGIEGRKEKQLSRSARRINAELATMDLESSQELFVWDDWVEFMELRKVVLCKHNLAICKQFKQTPSREMYLQNLEEKSQETINLSKDMVKKQRNMSAIFQHVLNSAGDKENNDVETLNFTPSFTPCHNYLKRLKLDPKVNSTFPQILHLDHSKRSLIPFLKPKILKETFSKCDKKLVVERVACTSKINYIGMFRNPLVTYSARCSHKINFTDDKTPWNVKLQADKPADSIFTVCEEKYTKKVWSAMNKKAKDADNEKDMCYVLKNEFSAIDNNLKFFEEDNMEPGNIRFEQPRRYLDRVNLFADLSDDEDHDMEQSHQESFCNASTTTTTTTETKLKISNFDCWLLIGKAQELNETQANELKRSLPLTFFWLLETCALTIRVDWRELYDELMVLETFFAYAIEPLENFTDRIIFTSGCEIREKNKLVRHFQTHW
ncbi:TATA box-binding protein-associated factor RNA polymerase I subunit B [Episyrphus balteatus]|uniref:TATA box-binding protein-associated factor RNA polymerase I subunit B n=1 Tax=Episyrphus balteatus TaxID=286459 RepID=UPI002485978A|nr:TATA box-binding protein-associated factor RNA polymerase I subunit B [Episyrphus balteatus]